MRLRWVSLAACALLVTGCTGVGPGLLGPTPITEDPARAQDRVAMSDLRNALATANTYYTEGDTYAGFDPAVASSIEPSLIWTATGEPPTGNGAVDIALVGPEQILLLADSPTGWVFCLADKIGGPGGNQTVRGRTMEKTPASWNDCDALADW